MCNSFGIGIINNMHNNTGHCRVTSAGVTFGNKSKLNLVHMTDITSKGKSLPSWEVSTHILQCQGQFLVAKKSGMQIWCPVIVFPYVQT